MINVSNNCKMDCDSDNVVYKEYIVINSTTVEIKGKMSNTAYKDTTFFGTFNLKSLQFITENDIDYKKNEFTYWKQVNGEAFKIGTYVVTDVSDSDTNEQVTVTAMDYGLKFANPYVTDLNYSSGTVTLLDVLQECCSKCGVELENTDITNGDFIVDGNQFVSSAQFGDVISAIALISGCFATINESDKVELIFAKATEDTEAIYLITEDSNNIVTEINDNLGIQQLEIIKDYTDLDDKRDTQPITSVALGFSNVDGEDVVRKDQDLINQYGEHWLIINDNPFAYSTAKQELLIDAIFEKVKGFGYSSFASKYSFKPYMQLGDLIQFKNKSGDLVKSIILKITTDYDDITLEAPSITDSSVNYVQPTDALTIAKKALVQVDNATGQIVLKATVDGKIVQATLNGDASDGSKFEVKADNIKLEGIVTANEKFKILNDGSMEAHDCTINGGLLYLSDEGDSEFPAIQIAKNDNSNVNTRITSAGIDSVSPNNGEASLGVGTSTAHLICGTNNGYLETWSSLNVESQNYLQYVLRGNLRVNVDNTESRLFSPNASAGIVVRNDETIITGYSTSSWIILTSVGVTASNDLSDKRLKKNIVDSTIDALDIIKQINFKEFDFKDKDKHIKNGFIAQQLEKLNGDLVNKTKLPKNLKNSNIEDDEVYTVDTLNILALATKAIQELNKKVEQQQDEINKLKEMVNSGYKENK